MKDSQRKAMYAKKNGGVSSKEISNVKPSESWTFTNKHGVDYELDDGDTGLYNDLYYQQIDEGDEK